MKTYRLLKDIKNPDHDKRNKYDYRQFEVLKGGTFFEGHPAHIDGDNRYEGAYVRSKAWRSVHGDVAALIIGNSVEADPTNWHEIATVDGGYHHFADDVIERLISNGDVTLKQIQYALAQCLVE